MEGLCGSFLSVLAGCHHPAILAKTSLLSSLQQRNPENYHIKAFYETHHLNVGKTASKLLPSLSDP